MLLGFRFEHHHSGIKFITSAERHAGKSEETLSKRQEVYEAAKATHPERWNGKEIHNWDNIEEVYLNPDKRVTETELVLPESSEAAAS